MRLLALSSGVALAFPLAALAALGLDASYSPSGWVMLLALALLVLGAFRAWRRRSGARGIAGGGLGLFALVVVVRVVCAGSGGTTVETLPGGGDRRRLARALDEQDASLVGARALAWAWDLPLPERAELVPAMHGAYVAMRAAEGITPSPVIDTFIGRQSPDAFDTIVIDPRGSARPADTAVVFLHGYGGSFTLECWMMAEAARTIGALTVCPATTFAGRWWTADGERTLRATLANLDARHIRRVFLAGLSNGAIGASLLALRVERRFEGLILISGASGNGGSRGLPTLVVHGSDDTRISAASARAFAARTGATYAGFEGGHFVMMVRRAEVREAIARFLAETMAHN
jgi:predicted esterase